MDQNSLIAIGIFSIICVICIATIGLALVKQNQELRNRLSEKSKSKIMLNYEVWLSSLTNNLASSLVREIKQSKCHWDFYHLDFAKEARLEENRKLQNENERLKKTIQDTEKRRTEAYDLIANVYEFEQTIMPTYGIYKAGAIDISELETELESSFREYFRREKLIKNKASQQDVTINTNRNVE